MMLSLAQLGWFSLALLLFRCLLYPTGWFRANRWYLLLIVPVTLALPGIAQFIPDLPKFSFNSPITPAQEVEILANEVARLDPSGEAAATPFPTNDFQATEAPISAPRFSLTDYCFYGYLLVVLVLMLKLIWSHWQVFKTIQQRSPLPLGEQLSNDTPRVKGFLLPEAKNLAFTYWTCYFVSPDQLTQDSWQHIQRHEAAHASGLHTVDLLLADLFVVFCWYFPPAWYYRQLLRSNLEFLADHQAISQANCRKNYLQTLIQTAQLRDGGPAFAFSTHPLKTRIMMLQTKALSFRQFATRSVLTALLLCLLTISCTESLDEVITPTTSHGSYDFYLTAFPNHQDLILLQAALEEVGAELFVSLRDGQFTHLKVTYGELGDREQLGGLAETCTPVRLTIDPAANLCQFNYHYEALPDKLIPGSIGILRNGSPQLLPTLPRSTALKIDPQDHSEYGFQIFRGPTAWEEAHGYIAANYPDLKVRYDYNGHPTNQSIKAAPADLTYIALRLTYAEPPQIRMDLHTTKFRITSPDDAHDFDLAAAARQLVKPHPELGVNYAVFPIPEGTPSILDDLLAYQFDGPVTHFYHNGQRVSRNIFDEKYADLDRMALVKSFLKDEPVVVWGAED